MEQILRSSDGPVYKAVLDMVELPPSFAPRRDPDWSFTDAAGHLHTDLSALVRKLDDPDGPEFVFDEDGEEYNAADHLECRLCGEWIRPGTIPPSLTRETVPGVMLYYRDDEPITREEFIAAVDPGLAG